MNVTFKHHPGHNVFAHGQATRRVSLNYNQLLFYTQGLFGFVATAVGIVVLICLAAAVVDAMPLVIHLVTEFFKFYMHLLEYLGIESENFIHEEAKISGR